MVSRFRTDGAVSLADQAEGSTDRPLQLAARFRDQLREFPDQPLAAAGSSRGRIDVYEPARG